jgi:glutamate carboxypeptidase
MISEKMVAAWFERRRSDMVDLLRDLVNTDSHTHDKAGVDDVVDQIRNFLETAGVKTRMIEQEVAGNLLHADIRPAGSNAVPVLLLGHCDTVFPKGEAARRPFQIVGARAVHIR